MDSEEVLILGVDDNADCLCLGGPKGKGSAHPGKRQLKKSSRNSKEPENCLVIVDGSEDGYVEMSGGGKIEKDSASNDLESVVGPPPKKLHMASRGDSDLTIVDATPKKPAQKKMKFHEDSITDDLTKVASLPSTATTSSSASSLPNLSKYDTDNKLSGPTLTKSIEDSSLSSAPPQSLVGAHHERVPTCWTNCPNCPPDMQRTYHLIDVAYNCAEWAVVSSPLTQLGYVVNRVQRIQNETLWQRLCYEKKLMLRDRHDVNEQLLYHTSRATIPVICEEGLDHRLSMNGHFGRGIYFSDSPYKCNSYWPGGGVSASRYMFCCRVLLGEIKKYPKGRSEQLKREPPKPNPLPGETKFYDSVMGNLTGLNEFVVYNAYRVMPEYVIRYSTQATPLVGPPPAATLLAASMQLSLSIPNPVPRMIPQLRKRKRRKKN